MRGIGRRPQPETLRALRGGRTRAHHRPQPTVAVSVPTRPTHLSLTEATIWDYYAPLLEAARVLTDHDREALVQFCEARAQIEEIKRLQADPDYRRVAISVTIDGAGNERVKAESNPLDAQRRAWTQIARMCAAELGLSPMSRARVSPVGASGEPDEAEAFLQAVK